jgi:hypothetical protein
VSGPFRVKDEWHSWATKLVQAGGAAVTVWAIYHPGDSTAVEQGDALGLTLGVMLWVLAAGIVYRITPSCSWRQASWWCDVTALGLAGWVFLSAWVNAGAFSVQSPTIGGDLRSATNEAWWWIAGAGFFVIARRFMSTAANVQAMMGLLLGVGALLAVHTLHQQYVSFPQSLQEYLSDPDGMLAKIGLEAPAGTAARMIFENRLRDGGPTATFALANSLAGPLAMILTLGGGCLVCWLRRLRHQAPETTQTPTWLFCAVSGACVLLSWALLMTGSRSGVLSVLIVGVGAFAWLVSIRIMRHRVSMMVTGLILIGCIFVFAGILYAKLFYDGSSLTGANATIALRIQYWRSTLAIADNAPWFGAGPGNFQLVYQKFREISAHELIAEPHNFVMETLASGGWVGVIFLCVCMVAAYVVYCRSREPSSSEDQTTQSHHQWAQYAFSAGAFAGLLSVWYAGILGNSLPDFDAHLIAVPLAIAMIAAWMVAFHGNRHLLTHSECRGIALAALAAGLIHVCFSGGWTVPGVSVVLLWLAGMVSSIPNNAPEKPNADQENLLVRRVIAGVFWGIALLWMSVFSWLPVAHSRELMAEALLQMQTNRASMAVESLRKVMLVDPLNRDAPIWLATIENQTVLQSLVTQSNRLPKQLAETDEAFAIAIQRTGNDPVRLRAISDLLVQRYQVGGRVEDLNAANDLIAKARDLSPMHEAITAQQAEIVRELNERGVSVEGLTAAQLAERATILADSGGAVVTRQLELQLILAARMIGRRAIDSPIQMPASDVLSLIR